MNDYACELVENKSLQAIKYTHRTFKVSVKILKIFVMRPNSKSRNYISISSFKFKEIMLEFLLSVQRDFDNAHSTRAPVA